MSKLEEFRRLFVETVLENTIYNNLSKDNYPSKPRNLLETASLCSYNSRLIFEHFIQYKVTEDLLNLWNNDYFVKFEFDWFSVVFLRKINMKARARTAISKDSKRPIIYLRANNFNQVLKDTKELNKLFNSMYRESLQLLSLIHEFCHALQVKDYGVSFFESCRNKYKNDVDCFLEIEAYATQAIVLSGNSQISLSELFLFVESVGKELEFMKEVVVKNKNIIENLYNVDRNLKESENLVSCCKGYSGGSLEDLKNILSEEDFKKLEEDE